MSQRTSASRARKQSQSSQRRSQARRAVAADERDSTRTRRRKSYVVAGALATLAVGGVVLAGSESIQDRIREVTLPLRHEDIIRQQAAQKEIPADLIAGVIYAESRFRDQESHAGARGLMQVTPQTAELIEDLSGGSTFVADDLSDPDINIRYGSFYLRYLLDKFGGNMIAALAAYNAGETNVAAWGGADLRAVDIRFQETRDYVDTVLEKRDEYREHYADELGLKPRSP
jgi:soluble lytic murein transglycosylase